MLLLLDCRIIQGLRNVIQSSDTPKPIKEPDNIFTSDKFPNISSTHSIITHKTLFPSCISI